MSVSALRPGPMIIGGQRQWVAVAATIAALAGASGLSSQLLFERPSLLKYVLTVAGPLLVAAAALAPRPLDVIAPVTIVAAPFGSYTMTVAGLSIPLLVVLIAAGAIAVIAEEPERRSLSALGVAGMCAAALLVFPIATARNPAGFAFLLATIVAMAWISSRTASRPGGLALVLGALAASALLQGAIAIWNHRTGHQLSLYGTAGTSVFGKGYFFEFGGANRPTGAFTDPISLGNVLCLALPGAVALAVWARSVLTRLQALAAAAVAVIGLALTLSRMSWIAAAAGVIVTIILMPRRTRRLALGGVVAVAVAVAVIGIGSGDHALQDRFASIFSPTGRTVETAAGDRQRERLWRAALETAESRPLAGTGFGNLQPQLERRVARVGVTGHAHSTYLQVLVEGGVFGAIVLALVIGATIRDVRRGLRRPDERVLRAAVAGAGVALAIVIATDYTIRYLPVAAMFAVVLGAVASGGRRTDARTAQAALPSRG